MNMKLLNTYDIFEYELISEATQDLSPNAKKKVMMRGILQKADTLNQNGRIYPLQILEREVRNYQKLIIENRALGECVPPGTEIMTRDGWKKIEDISEDEMIFTLNLQNNEMQLQRIKQKVVLPYEGKMYRFKNHGTYDMTLTADHKVLIWDRKNEPKKITAAEMYAAYTNRNSSISHSSLRRAGAKWVGEENEYFMLGDQKVDSTLWAAFLGIYLSEGHSSGVKKHIYAKNHKVVITQKNVENSNSIRQLLSKLPWDFKEKTRKDGITKDFVITDHNLHAHLYPLGSSRQKYVPGYTKGWSTNLQSTLLEWLLLGDGRHRKNKEGGLIDEYCTTSKKLASDVEEIMLKLGYGATIHVWDRNYDRPSPEKGRIIKAGSSADMNIIYKHLSKSMSLDFRFMQAEEFDYKGEVFCVTVANSTWLMRSNGKVCWTGNCDHPETSVINLKNVSHVIREAVLENGVVKGVVEILNTPSGKILQDLIEAKVKLGISSRGVGTTKKEGDYQVVQDDFQLICWDFVSEPSTPGAFMLPEGKNVSSLELKKIFTKSDRLNRVINDINSYKKVV